MDNDEFFRAHGGEVFLLREDVRCVVSGNVVPRGEPARVVGVGVRSNDLYAVVHEKFGTRKMTTITLKPGHVLLGKDDRCVSLSELDRDQKLCVSPPPSRKNPAREFALAHLGREVELYRNDASGMAAGLRGTVVGTLPQYDRAVLAVPGRVENVRGEAVGWRPTDGEWDEMAASPLEFRVAVEWAALRPVSAGAASKPVVRFPHSCRACGQPAFDLAFVIECTNPRCRNHAPGARGAS